MSDRLAQLVKLHAADPADPFCTYGIALEHGKAGRLTEALTWLDKTIALDANYCYAYYQKARLLAQNGQEEDARAVLEHALPIAAKADAHAHSEMLTLLDSLE